MVSLFKVHCTCVINCLLVTLALLIYSVECTEVLRPRGVSFEKKIFYDPRKDFTCLDGLLTLPFSQVNDEYCDCADGSDEPGTSACENGTFHCPNVGYIALNIPSSRVNDGICDCCDSSDEYASKAACKSECLALGEQARTEQRRQLQLLKQGSEVRASFIEEAKVRKQNDALELSKLKAEITELEQQRLEKEAVKKAAEDKEKAALDRHQAAVDAKKKAQEEAELAQAQEAENRAAITAFAELDTDQDGRLTYQEIQAFGAVFDQNNDGTVSYDEAKFYLHAQESVDLNEFLANAWVIIKPFYLRLKSPVGEPMVTESPSQGPPEVVTASKGELEEEDEEAFDEDTPHDTPADHEREEEDDDLLDAGRPFESPDPQRTPASGSSDSEYDEETKQLVELSRVASQEFREIDSRYQDVQRRLTQLEDIANTDFGPDDSFLALLGQCFEMTDREYTYKLCPFDRASQRPKDGGSETSLGQWSRWLDAGHSRMKYEGGSTCWNGPARSVDVIVSCGLENKLTSASEPSRCEYQFEFATPAICLLEEGRLPPNVDPHQHEEL